MRKKYKIIFIIAVIVIELLAFKQSSNIEITLGWDKLNHAVAFMTLYILLSFASKGLDKTAKFLLLLAFAFQIEIVQYFLPYRDFSLLDVVADMVGVVAGHLLCRIVGAKLIRDIV